MKLLIVYGTTEGHTRKICDVLAEEAGKTGWSVELHDASQHAPAPKGYDAVVIAASLHAGRYQSQILDYTRTHSILLNAARSAFLSVSLAAATDDKESWKELEEQTRRFLTLAQWKPDHVEQVAGALLYTQYDFFKRFIMRLISKRSGGETDTSRDFEYTDWNQVKGVLDKLKG